MPIRLEPLANNNVYHIFNKTIDSRNIFNSEGNCIHFIELLKYYRSVKSTISFSKLESLDKTLLEKLLESIYLEKYFKSEVFAYSLMPTHFHLLLKQKKEKGIQTYIANVINAFTKYLNIKIERKGPVFLPNFQSVQIRNDTQLIHVSRYIHLNPYSGSLINSLSDLKSYRWSSFKAYVSSWKDELVSESFILNLFNYDRDRYRSFVFSNAEHQKTLEYAKHAAKW